MAQGMICVNNLCEDAVNANYHFYADDTILYSSSPSLAQTTGHLQLVFDML